MREILRRIGWSIVMVFLGLWLFSTRTCAQDALPDTPVTGHACLGYVLKPEYLGSKYVTPEMLTMQSIVCPEERTVTLSGGTIVPWTGEAIVTTQNAPKRHSWAYRHLPLLGIVAGGTVGLVWALTHREGCPHTVSGFPYDGNGRPCPTYCEAKGDCYWPAK